MKKTMGCLLALLLLLSAEIAAAQEKVSFIITGTGTFGDRIFDLEHEGTYFEYIVKNGEATIIIVGSTLNDRGKLNYPAKAHYYPVVEITGERTYAKYPGLREFREHYGAEGRAVTVPEGVRKIGYGTFNGIAFKSITLPQSLEEIGEEAFAGSSLNHLRISPNLRVVGPGAFAGCEKLTEVTVPEGHPVFKAQDGFLIDHTTMTALFYYGESSKASLPEGVLAIQDRAFMNQPKLKELTLPSTLEKIGPMAFTGSVLTKFTVAEGNPSFEAKDDVLFEKGMAKLICYPPSAKASKYKTPDETTSVANHAFFEVKNLKSLDLNAVVSLGEYAVSCTEKRSIRVTAMAAVREIGKQAFEYCSFGDRLTLPGDLKTLEWGAFYGAAFKHLVLEEGIRQIPAYAFARNKALLTVQIPQSITTVEGAAFKYCTSLKEIRGVEHLDNLNAFEGCEKLPSSYFK